MNYSHFIIPHSSVHVFDMDNIGPSPDPVQLRNEIELLKDDHIILRTFPYVLMICDLNDRPALSQELGRQREITFRRVGESTGQSIDIDKYDEYCDQLIIWDESADKLVGGYRFGCGDEIFATHGRDGFYIHSFFSIDEAFDAYLPYCLELGRSFIVEDYQRKNLPLYLLWKGILAFQSRNPKYKYLIGPVSISRFYSDLSRKILMEYARKHLFHGKFSPWFIPRIPFDPLIDLHGDSYNELNVVTPDFENIMEHIQPEHIRFPVLMKQYIRQNAKFLGFNLDPNFNNALDGLMILDIADVPMETMELLQREMQV